MIIKKNPSSRENDSLMTKILKIAFSIPIAAACLFLTVFMLLFLLSHIGTSSTVAQGDATIMDKFDQYVVNDIMTQLDGFVDVERVYWLNDNDQVAPEPNQSAFGETDDPSSLQWLLDEAADLLDGQELLFSLETDIAPGSVVSYYLDDTILAITWKQLMHNYVYTFSEVKIAHASQFRRFLSNGMYGSGVLHTTSEMASSVNAVVASAGDYYGYRSIGVIVNNGTIYRNKPHTLDTCFINDEGDLLFVAGADLAEKDATEKFVEENNVRFTICFGPILLQDGVYAGPARYAIGEIGDRYSRAALCQMGKLHYVVVTANMERGHNNSPTLRMFAESLASLGIKKAYTLDGGQTATIVMNDKVMNTVSYGAERDISDIIYFATALPNHQS